MSPDCFVTYLPDRLPSKPVSRAPACVGYSHDLYSNGRFSEDYGERESV
jgi:hypothetical protein